MIQVKRVTQAEFDSEYNKAFTPVSVPSDDDKESLREAISTTQQCVVDALKASWVESDDFYVGWDFNYCYHVCGGIYSDRIVCPEYLLAVDAALKAAPFSDRWTYHTACETDSYNGEFFIRNGTLFISEDSDPVLLVKLGIG